MDHLHEARCSCGQMIRLEIVASAAPSQPSFGHPDEQQIVGFLRDYTGANEFLSSLRRCLEQWGQLTTRQLEAAERTIQRLVPDERGDAKSGPPRIYHDAYHPELPF